MQDELVKVSCYFCGEETTTGRPVDQPQVHYVECPGCTNYSITEDAILEMESNALTSRQSANASGWLREHRGSMIDHPEITKLRSLPTPPPLDKAAKLFELLLVACPDPGKWYDLEFANPALRSAAWAEGAQELEWVLSECLVAQLRLLEKREDVAHEQFMMARITPRGWDVLEARKNLPYPKRPLGFTG